MVNYFFPIRLNVLIVMGLDLLKCGMGPAEGLAFLEGPEPNFWRRTQARAVLEPDIWGRPRKFEGSAFSEDLKPGPVLLGPNPSLCMNKNMSPFSYFILDCIWHQNNNATTSMLLFILRKSFYQTLNVAHLPFLLPMVCKKF